MLLKWKQEKKLAKDSKRKEKEAEIAKLKKEKFKIKEKKKKEKEAAKKQIAKVFIYQFLLIDVESQSNLYFFEFCFNCELNFQQEKKALTAAKKKEKETAKRAAAAAKKAAKFENSTEENSDSQSIKVDTKCQIVVPKSSTFCCHCKCLRR